MRKHMICQLWIINEYLNNLSVITCTYNNQSLLWQYDKLHHYNMLVQHAATVSESVTPNKYDILILRFVDRA